MKDNLHRFLKTISCSFPIVEQELAIYFEYAFLRDLWNFIDKKETEIDKRNKTKKNVILDFLKPISLGDFSIMSTYEFNKYFGAVPRPSSTDIQSPGNWSIRFYDDNIENNEEFLKTCKFKWCFNWVLIFHSQ